MVCRGEEGVGAGEGDCIMHPKSRGQYFFPYIFKTVFLWHRLWSINRTRRDKRTGRDLDLLAMANCQQDSSIII